MDKWTTKKALLKMKRLSPFNCVAIRRMNAELEAKTAALVRQAEEVMVSYLQMMLI